MLAKGLVLQPCIRKSWDENVRHQRSAEGEESQAEQANEACNSSTEASKASEEGREPSYGSEEKRDENKDPSESPHVVEVIGRSMPPQAAAQAIRDILSTAIPSLAKGRRRASSATVLVVTSAEVEVGPLGNVASASDAGSVGTQEVDLVERRGRGHARKNDEPE